jgi:uncharacterized YigZ family protein
MEMENSMSKIKLRPASNVEIRNKIKDSKFYGSIFAVGSREEAEKRITQIKEKYNDATHNVSAYRVESDRKNGEFIEYFDDDGEPAGSSGPPILKVIKGEELVNTVIVVTRYFGGTKLGIGGLIRAYSETARLAVKEAGIESLKKFYEIDVFTEFDKLGVVLGQLEAFGADIKNTEYNNKGGLVSAEIPAETEIELKRNLKEKTADKFKLTIKKEVFH